MEAVQKAIVRVYGRPKLRSRDTRGSDERNVSPEAEPTRQIEYPTPSSTSLLPVSSNKIARQTFSFFSTTFFAVFHFSLVYSTNFVAFLARGKRKKRKINFRSSCFSFIRYSFITNIIIET